MSKGQSTIVEYVIFFAIGISLFVGLSNIFFSQYSWFNKDFTSSNTALLNSFVSSDLIYFLNQCPQCQKIEHSIDFLNNTKNFRISMTDNGIVVSNPVTKVNYSSSAHNLNYTFSMSGGSVLGRRITLSSDKLTSNLSVR